jgi:hypothetical protein
VSSVRTVSTRRSAKQFARGPRGGILTASTPRIGQDRVERGRELSSAIADEEPELRGALAEVHHEVGGLLGRPTPVGMPGHAQDVQVAGADLENEQDIEPPQCHGAVDVEEVDSQRARRLRAQELPPAGVGVPQRRRWGSGDGAGPADGRGADAMAEFEQLALDPAVAPARVLARHPRHQRGDDVADRWASGPVRVGPPSAQEAPVPAQNRSRGDQAVTAQLRRQPPDQGRIRAAKTARSAQFRPGVGLVRRRMVTIMPDCWRAPITAGQQRVPRSGTPQPT